MLQDVARRVICDVDLSSPKEFRGFHHAAGGDISSLSSSFEAGVDPSMLGQLIPPPKKTLEQCCRLSYAEHLACTGEFGGTLPSTQRIIKSTNEARPRRQPSVGTAALIRSSLQWNGIGIPSNFETTEVVTSQGDSVASCSSTSRSPIPCKIGASPLASCWKSRTPRLSLG